MKKKISILLTVIILVVIVIVYNYITGPTKITKDVLNQISETSLATYEISDFDEYNKTVEKQYSCYFTEESYNQAISKRYFSLFYDPRVQKDTIYLESISLKYLQRGIDEATIVGTFEENYLTPDNVRNETSWDVNVRLMFDGGRWLISYIKLY